MSEKRNLATLVPICSLSIGDLARKGWKTRNRQFINDSNCDDYTSSSDDELSISWSSSPGTADTKDPANTKNMRHIVTKLNFDDCIVKANQVSIATVERIIKPLNADECSTVTDVADCSIGGPCQDSEPQFNTFSSIKSLSDELTCVPESPNVGTFNKTKRFEGLQFVHDERISTCDKREPNSQEIPIHSPPKCYNLEEHFKIMAPKAEELPLVLVKDSSPLKIRSSSPIMQSSRKKKKIPSESQFYELQTQKGKNNLTPLVVVDTELTHQKEKSLHGNVFSKTCSGIDTKKSVDANLYCEMSSLDVVGLLQSPTSSQTPTKSSKDNISSPVFGSKKKRQFFKFRKDKRLKKYNGSVSSDRKPLMPVNKNNENISFQNLLDNQSVGEEEVSSVMNSKITYDNKINEFHFKSHTKPSEHEEGKQSNVIIDIKNQISQVQKQDKIQLKSSSIDMFRSCIQTSALDSSLNLQNNGDTSLDLNDGMIPSQPITCVSANKLSRRRVKRKLRLTNFTTHTQHTQSHTSWSQTFVTQETVTYYCIRNSDAMNTNSDREPSQLLNIFKAKLLSNTRDQIRHDSQDLQLTETEVKPLADSFLDQGIICLPENDCNKSSYAISLDCTPEISKFNENNAMNRDKSLSTVEESRKELVIHATEQPQECSSEMSISNDVIQCSQEIVESSMRAKRLKANICKHKINDFVRFNNFDATHFVKVARNKVVGVSKSNSSWIENDILNTSNYIENVSSDEEVTVPEENNKIVARIVSNSRKTMPSTSVKSNLDNTCNILVEMNQLCSTPDAKNTKNDVTPVKKVLNSVPEMKNISDPHITKRETNTLSQHISCIGSLRSCRISQEESPRPSSSENDELQVHISSGSSHDPDLGLCTPPRMAASPVNMDSGKKRKRLKKDGLAARLQRLLAHKQAATHLCKYEVSVGTRRPGDSVLLVKSAWMEYSRLLVLCSPCPTVEQLQNSSKDIKNDSGKQRLQGMCTRDSEENVVSLWVVVLDPVLLPFTQLKENAVIRIYAPWQTMYVPRIAVTMVLDVTYVELVSSTSNSISPSQTCAVCKVDTFHCPCMDGASKPENCEFQLPNRGKQLWTLLSPALTKSQMSLSQTSNMQIATMDSGTQKGTIAEAIMQHSRALTSGIWLNVKILRVFCYRSLEAEDEDQHMNVYNLIWSVLCEDSSREYCEVVLGSPCENPMSNEWEKIINGRAIGHLYRIADLNVSKRLPSDIMYRVQGFLRKSSNTNMCTNDYSDLSEQRFFYVFSATNEKWNCENKETTSGDILPKVVTLSNVLKKIDDGSWRLTVLVKALAFWNFNLYIVDPSLEEDKDNVKTNCVRINMKPSCYLPQNILTKNLCFQDLLLYKGEFFADKYCRVFSHENIDAACTAIDLESIAQLDKLSLGIPEVEMSSQIKDLVLVAGCVLGVDEETALSWPVCKQCQRDLIENKHHHQLLCEHCGLTEPITKLSLEVILSCSNLPKLRIKVKVKLLQKSILSLLPGALEGTSFEVENVLGKSIGPLVCVVLEDSPSRISSHSPSYDMLLQEVQFLGESHELSKIKTF